MTPIVFARSISLGVAAPSLTLASIPQTAAFLVFHVAARLEVSTTDDLSLDLTINSDATAQYDGNTTKGNTGGITTGLANDGSNQAAWRLADLTTADAPAGLRTEVWGIIPRYAVGEFHSAMWLAHAIDGTLATDLWRTFGGGVNDAVAAGISSLTIAAEGGANLAAGSQILVWGLGDSGDVIPAAVARSALGSTVIDFTGDEFRDYTASAGANNFSSTNERLGRTISVRISGGDGTTTIGLPAGTQLLEDTYVAGDPAWLILRCTNEAGPEFIATLKGVV